MNLILNIGLEGVPVQMSYTNGVPIPLVTRQFLATVQTVRAAGFRIQKAFIAQSDTEPTAVLSVDDHDDPGLDNRIDMLSTALGQDCIAVWNLYESFGQLIGPRADKWGEFNPKFFIMPDGTRLSTYLE
jgi:hypothetical protein